MDWAVVVGLTSALAWPVLIGVILLWLRKPLKALVPSINKVSAGGLSVELSKRKRLEHELEEAVDVLDVASDTDQQQQAGNVPEVATDPVSGEDASIEVAIDPARNRLDRRKALEEVVRSAAEWGHARRDAGFNSADAEITWEGPEPKLDLPEVVQPVPSLWEVMQRLSGKTPGAAPEYIANLEERVKELERERATMMMSGTPWLVTPIDQQLKDATARLRDAHPNSGLL